MNQSRCNALSAQAGTLAFLQDELARRDPGTAVAVIETHISVILLSATRAWKLKKAVTLPYLDFASAQTRLALCQRELELNRRTAPAIYRAVHQVIRRAGGDMVLTIAPSLQIPGGDAVAGKGGIGADDGTTLVDAVLEMERFEQDQLLDRMAVDGALSPQLITRLAQGIAAFHKRAPPLLQAGQSGSQRIGDILDINEQALARAGGLLDAATVRRVTQALRARWRQHDSLLDQRQHAGHVRRCHGDLHLRNIVAIDGVPTLFDCLEFDEDMATTDVLYDLAFVLMDLWHRELPALANLLFNRYLDEVDESTGLPLLGLFMAMRATVRAHVTATRAQEMPTPQAAQTGAREAVIAEAGAYLALAGRLLAPRPVRLIAIGGLSGSGKSTAAAAIADQVGPAPGARVLSSDRQRKQLLGVPPLTRLSSEAYEPDVSARVYARLREAAATVIALGHGAVVDAVFDRLQDRDAVRAVADAAGVAFQGIWLQAPTAVLLDRVEQRRDDPSDAGIEVVHRQLQRDPGRMDWRRIDAGGAQAPALLRKFLD